jgi:hypothetical protein
MIDAQQARRLIGTNLVDSEGTKVGSIGQLYLDDRSERPEWVCVHTGLFGSKETFVPLAEATIVNGEVRVPYLKDQIKDAPSIDADGTLSPGEENALYGHYGLSPSAPCADDTVPDPTSGPLVRTETDIDSGITGPQLGAGMPVDADTGMPRGRLRRWTDDDTDTGPGPMAAR